MDGAQRIVELAQSADEHDLVICLISGGGSALLPLPVEGVSLADKQAMSDVLIPVRGDYQSDQYGPQARLAGQRRAAGRVCRAGAGAHTGAVGCRRQSARLHCQRPDGSRLDHVRRCADVLRQFDAERAVPASVWRHIERGAAGQVGETPKETDTAIFERTRAILVGSNEIAAEAARAAARRRSDSVSGPSSGRPIWKEKPARSPRSPAPSPRSWCSATRRCRRRPA